MARRLMWLVLMALSVGPFAAHAQAPATHASPRTARAGATESAPPLVDINSADAKALDALPGVGDARVKAIVAGRPYADKQELVTRKILPANVFAAIENQIALANVNTASAADMAKILPNVGPVRAAAIVKNRPYGTPQEMVTKGALTQSVFESIKPLVTAK